VDVWCLMLCFQAQRIHSNDQLGCREKWQKWKSYQVPPRHIGGGIRCLGGVSIPSTQWIINSKCPPFQQTESPELPYLPIQRNDLGTKTSKVYVWNLRNCVRNTVISNAKYHHQLYFLIWKW
jgi:hypothetical protein